MVTLLCPGPRRENSGCILMKNLVRGFIGTFYAGRRFKQKEVSSRLLEVFFYNEISTFLFFLVRMTVMIPMLIQEQKFEIELEDGYFISRNKGRNC